MEGHAVEKEEMIQHLYVKSKHLERILAQIDRDVDEAAAKYLKDWKPAFAGEKLTFARFLALLSGEMTKTLRLEWVNSKDSPLKKAMEAKVIKDFEERLAVEIIGNKLSVVVHTLREEDVMVNGIPAKRPVYRASCLERRIQVDSESKRDIIEKWLIHLRSKLVRGPITRFEYVENKDIQKMFYGGALLHEEKVDKYTVTIKGFPEKVFCNA